MKNRNKKVTTYFILFSLLLIGIIYAILQANLQINGIAKIKSNSWDIHFDNIEINENSVSIGENDSAATIDPNNNCKIDFEVTLSLPGDFYEFTVDVVNAGTIDGMIGELNKSIKVNNEIVSEIPDFLEYSITYEDGMEIIQNHALNAGTTETYLVRLEFRSDIEELPEATTVVTTLEPHFIQKDSGAIMPNHPKLLLDTIAENAVIDSVVSTYVTNENGVQLNAISSDTNGKGIYLRAETENDNYPIYYYRGDVDNNHLIFANFCWRIVRTTDTGGVKLLYDGVPSNGECNNTEKDTRISTGNTTFNTYTSGPAYVGYMYGDGYTYSTANGTNWYYGPDVTYANGVYTLTAKGSYGVEAKSTISGTNLNYHHYTCGSTTDTTCTSVRYVYYVSSSTAYYITLSNGIKIEDALSEMLTNSSNSYDSTIKRVIDNWYRSNMTDYTSYLEDTIYCNDRSISSLGGWNPNGGATNGSNREYDSLIYNGYNRACKTYNPTLNCASKNDSFTVSESAIGNGKLTYPVGLLTSDEVMLAGGKCNTDNTSYYLNSGTYYWLASPFYFYRQYAFDFVMHSSSGTLSAVFTSVAYTYGVRPVVSLKLGTKISGGTGTSSDPYVVK
ncbi:MAG: hypothetical protein IJG68_02580 [Bacilli bacterium]|nr:hypothetical protein [Bacilli bacterium]